MFSTFSFISETRNSTDKLPLESYQRPNTVVTMLSNNVGTSDNYRCARLYINV